MVANFELLLLRQSQLVEVTVAGFGIMQGFADVIDWELLLSFFSH